MMPIIRLKLLILLSVLVIVAQNQEAHIQKFKLLKYFPYCLDFFDATPSLDYYVCFTKQGFKKQIHVKTPSTDFPQILIDSINVVWKLEMSNDGRKIFVDLQISGKPKEQRFYHLTDGTVYQLIMQPGITDVYLPNFSLSNNMQYFIAYCTATTCVGTWDDKGVLTLDKEVIQDSGSIYSISDDGNQVVFGKNYRAYFYARASNTEDFMFKYEYIDSWTKIAVNYLDLGMIKVVGTKGVETKVFVVDLNAENISPKEIIRYPNNLYMESQFSENGQYLAMYNNKELVLLEFDGDQFQTLTQATQDKPWVQLMGQVLHDINLIQNSSSTIFSIASQPFGTLLYIREGCSNNCVCPPGQEWNTESSSCEAIDCRKKLYTVNDQLNENLQCNCIEHFSWNKETKQCETNCRKDPGSTKVLLPTGQCQCLLYYYWDDTNHQCRPHCYRGLANGIDSINPQICECKAPAIWNQDINDCYINCSSIAYSTGQHQSPLVCECKKSSQWNISTLACEIDCSRIAKATGKNDESACQCPYPTHQWDDINLKCRRKCEDDPKSTGVMKQDGSCQCKGAYRWDFQVEKCLNDDCDGILYSTGIADGDACKCQEFFVWDQNKRLCVIQCSALQENLLGIQDPVPLGAYQCPCKEGALWIIDLRKCAIDCSLIEFAATRSSYNACSCRIGYKWVPETNQCVQSCGQEPGESQVFENGRCQCLQKYYWSSYSNGCYRDCSLIDNANGIIPGEPEKCQCYDNFVWKEQKCMLACDGLFDEGYNSDTNECSCQINSVWFSNRNQCVVKCSLDPLSTGEFETDRCKCNINAEWNDFKNKCECVEEAIYNTDLQKCQLPSSLAYLSMGVIGGAILFSSLIFGGVKAYKKRQTLKELDNVVVIGNESGPTTTATTKAESQKSLKVEDELK